MSEIRANEIGTFWRFPVVDIPIDKLSVYIKRNLSLKGEKKEWETIDDPIVAEMLRFPIGEEDVLNVLGPGEYTIALRYRKDDGGPLLCYGKEVYIEVGVEKEAPPEVVAPTPSPETEMLKATLEKYDKRDQTMMEMLTKLAGQEKSTDSQFKDQLLLKLLEQQKPTDSGFNEQILLKLLDKMGNQVDVGAIYNKVFETTSQIMADSKKEDTELKRQESKQKHEINLITLEQRLEAGAAGLAGLKNDGTPEDEVKKANVVQDIVDALSKVGPIVDNFAQFVEKVKPTILSIKDIMNVVKGTPLAGDVADEGGEGSEEEEPLAEEDQPAEEPAAAEDKSPPWVNKGAVYDPNDPRKQ